MRRPFGDAWGGFFLVPAPLRAIPDADERAMLRLIRGGARPALSKSPRIACKRERREQT